MAAPASTASHARDVRTFGQGFLIGLAIALAVGAVATDTPVALLLAAIVIVLLVASLWT